MPCEFFKGKKMSRKITLEEGFEAWKTWRQSHESSGDHIPPEELYEFLIHPSEVPDRNNLLSHLTRCGTCLQEFEELVQSRAEAKSRMETWDFALPKAAASEIEGPRKIITEGGQYTIEIRPHVSDRSRGLATVQVSPQHREGLEGTILTLIDGKGRVVLQGHIVNGEVAQEIDNLEDLRPPFIVQAQST